MVDLTPLLDVILIMLFLIMSQSRDTAREAQEQIMEAKAAYAAEMSDIKGELENARQELDDAREELYYADNRIHAYEKFDRFSLIVSLSLRETEGDREIYISDGTGTRSILFDWDSMRYGENALKNALGKYKDSSEPVFIVFSYDSAKIYQRDYDMVSSVMSSVQSGSENIYIKFDERSDKNG